MDKEFDLENEKVTIERNGETIECDVLFTFNSEDTGKAYIGYTDHSIASNGRKNIYVSSFDPMKGIKELENITDQKELAMINDVLMKIDNM